MPAVGRELGGSDGVEAHQPACLGRAIGELAAERLCRVYVTPTADRGGDDANARRHGGEREGQVQPAGERLLDQAGEEGLAGDVRGLAGGQLLQRSGGAEQLLDGGIGEESREQAAERVLARKRSGG